MRVDFTVIALLDTEHEVDPAPLEQGLVNAEVPRCALEAMQKVGRHSLGVHFWVTHISHVLHLELLVAIQVHKALLKEDFFVQEAFVSSQFLETVWDAVITITDDHDEEVVLSELSVLVELQAIVVVEATSQGRLQFCLVLVVHGDAYGELGVFFSDAAPRSDLRDHACVLDLPVSAIATEASRAQL